MLIKISAISPSTYQKLSNNFKGSHTVSVVRRAMDEQKQTGEFVLVSSSCFRLRSSTPICEQMYCHRTETSRGCFVPFLAVVVIIIFPLISLCIVYAVSCNRGLRADIDMMHVTHLHRNLAAVFKNSNVANVAGLDSFGS